MFVRRIAAGRKQHEVGQRQRGNREEEEPPAHPERQEYPHRKAPDDRTEAVACLRNADHETFPPREDAGEQGRAHPLGGAAAHAHDHCPNDEGSRAMRRRKDQSPAHRHQVAEEQGRPDAHAVETNPDAEDTMKNATK